MKTHTHILVILVIVLLVAGLVASFRKAPSDKGNNDNNAVACTMDAKMCPDGSYVGRTGPKCEFAACPGPSQGNETKGEVTASLNQKVSVGDISGVVSGDEIFITPLEVVSDSRCPIDVTCIWAGEVQLKVRLEKGTASKEFVIKGIGEEGTAGVTPALFENHTVALIAVSPENNSKKPFAKEDYRFTFKVSPVEMM